MQSNKFLRWLSTSTKTAWWHDSAIPEEVGCAIADGAVGVTTNPVLVAASLSAIPGHWRERLVGKIDAKPGEAGRAESILRVVTSDVATMLVPAFDRSKGDQGYVCAQVNPRLSWRRRRHERDGQAHSLVGPEHSHQAAGDCLRAGRARGMRCPWLHRGFDNQLHPAAGPLRGGALPAGPGQGHRSRPRSGTMLCGGDGGPHRRLPEGRGAGREGRSPGIGHHPVWERDHEARLGNLEGARL